MATTPVRPVKCMSSAIISDGRLQFVFQKGDPKVSTTVPPTSIPADATVTVLTDANNVEGFQVGKSYNLSLTLIP